MTVKSQLPAPATGNPVTTGEKQGAARPDHLTWFKPGQSGNPAGRPKGSRHRLSEQFIGELCADFEEHGRNVIEEVRRSDPVAYLAICAKLVPKEFGSLPDNGPQRDLSEYSDAELVEIIETARGMVRPVVNVTIAKRAAVGSGEEVD